MLIDHYSGPSLYTSLEDDCGVCRQSGAKRIDWLRTFPHVIDPWAIKKCDAVLITHFHPDHCDPYTIVPLSETTNAKFIGPKIVCSKLKGYGVSEDRIIQLKWGESKKVGDTTIVATETADRTLLLSGKEPPKKNGRRSIMFFDKNTCRQYFS